MKLQNLIPSIISVNDQGELVELSPEVVESRYPGIKYILFPGSKKLFGVIRNDELHYIGEEVLIRRDKFGGSAPSIKRPGKGKIESIRRGEGDETIKGPYDFGIRMQNGDFDYVRPTSIQSIPAETR